MTPPLTLSYYENNVMAEASALRLFGGREGRDV